MKFAVKLAVVALCVGGILFAIGHAQGGTVYSAWYNHQLIPWNQLHSFGIEQDDTAFDDENFTGQIRNKVQKAVSDIKYIYDHSLDHPLASIPDDRHSPSARLSDAQPENDAIHSLHLELGRGRYTLQSGNAFSVTGTGLEQIETWTDDTEWHVSYTGGMDTIMDANDRNIIITIPEGKQFDEIELTAGAAAVTTGALNAHTIDIEVGAGTLETGTLTTKELCAEVGAGQAVIALAGDWSEYQYEIESGMGLVTANDDTLASGLGGECSGGTGSRVLDLEVGMGSIALTTQTH